MENGQAPPDTLLCGRCGAVCDLEDNFCRQCGLALHEPQLPVRHEGALPAVWRPPLPAAVMRGAAVVAVGALTEMLLRRLARSVLRGGRHAQEAGLPATTTNGAVARTDERMPEDTQMVSETLLLRRVRFRR